VVGDRTLFVEAIAAALESNGLRVLAVAHGASAALRGATRHVPEVVLVDMDLADGEGRLLCEQIPARVPGTKVVAITSNGRSAAALVPVGVAGSVSKHESLARFISRVRAYLSDDVVAMRASSVGSVPEDRHAALLAGSLTRRELQVLDLLTQGRSGDDIGAALSISPNTVRTHVGNILTKLQVHSRLEAVSFAVRHRLVLDPLFQRRRDAPRQVTSRS
jgi:two-component system nitrate/nitrite response regulator NarL